MLTGSILKVYLLKKGVEVLFGARVTRIDDDVIEYVQKGWTRKLLGVDTIVLAAGARANDTLWKIAEIIKMANIFPVGYCVKARNAMEAIYEGSKIAREI